MIQFTKMVKIVKNGQNGQISQKWSINGQNVANISNLIPKHASLHGTQNVAFAPILYEKNSF
jgi:hypothetical protein